MISRRVQRAGVPAVLALALLSSSCGKVVREGTSPAYLVIDSLTASRGGAKSTTAVSYLESDVVTVVEGVATVFEDPGSVALHVAMKDIVNPTSPAEPSPNNLITINRYRVEFVRADGRNTPGVDVPYPFDGAITGTIGGTTSSLGFVLVRAQAKLEAPLMAMRGGGGAFLISTIAKVTFYGKDQTGNTVSITGQISVNFADWGDEK